LVGIQGKPKTNLKIARRSENSLHPPPPFEFLKQAFQAWSNRLAKSGNNQGSKEEGEPEPQPHPEASTDPSRPTEGAAESGTANAPTSNGTGSSHRQGASTTGTVREKDYPKNIAKPPAGEDTFSPKELEQMEVLLDESRGTLVVHPLRFLEAEDKANNLVFSMDWIGPFQVYC